MIESLAMDDRQRGIARRMGAEPTDAERVLWQPLRHDIKLVVRTSAARSPSVPSSSISPAARQSS
jgi:hypothetical protein